MFFSRKYTLSLYFCVLSALTPTVSAALTPQQAAHFLNQATFGATLNDITSLVASASLEGWINTQANLPASPSQEAYVRARQPYVDGELNAIDTWAPSRHDQWWVNIIEGQDQLRQRMAWALSQIFVVSEHAPALADSQYGLASYYDMLANHAFGNFRDLLEDVTLHPAMGLYLSMLRNEKADPARNVRPDENYAREVMQLFTIGLHQLNLDGSLQLDGEGNAIPTYDEANIRELAEVFTGWNFANINWHEWWGEGSRTSPMVANQAYHDTSTKLLLNTVLPAGQSAEADLDGALDDLFNHPNVGPFISKQLIQRFVTSNPSPAYVARVASIFNDDGSVNHQRGNLLAVIKAILLDNEATNGWQSMSNTFGKLREPVIRLTHLMRAFKGFRVDGGEWQEYPGTWVYLFPNTGSADTYNLDQVLGQTVLRAPSVFNFYLPDYAPPGVTRDNHLLAPEFQINTENNQIGTADILNFLILHWEDDEEELANPSYSRLDLSSHIALAETSLEALLDQLDLTLLSGQMSSQFRQNVLAHMNDDSFNLFEIWEVEGYRKAEWQTRDAITLITMSPEYLIQR